MRFVGDGIRSYEALDKAVKKTGVKYHINEELLRREREAGPARLKKKKRMIRMVEKYVDYIISGPSMSQLLTRNYSRIYVPIDIDNIRYNNIPNEKPVVVHAPSNSADKGTPYILKAVEQLKEEGYDFEFYLYENTSNVLVREALSNADISVDQLFGLAPGMFALESMAAGCAVLCSSIPEFAGMPPEVPTIHTDPDNIYQNLKMLLDNPELRQDLGEKGRRYVEIYHDHRKIADDYSNLIATGGMK
jgi:glycosyltransferase involved in cell wall biosynthesis